MTRRVVVVGGGSWGTAVAKMLAERGGDVTIWAREPEVVDAIATRRENTMFLAGVRLPENLRATGELEEAVHGAAVVVNAVPTQYIRSVFSTVRPPTDALLVSLSKGVELDSLLTPHEVFAEITPGPVTTAMVALSGPSFAREVAAGHPTAVVAASRDEKAAKRVQELFSSETFRVYTSQDIVSVELGGALKNVIAIAAGIVDGLRYGHNTLVALITRGVAEITRLGVAKGGDPLTFAGLSGMGDLVLTCTGELSRNRTVGQLIGKGKTLDEITREMHMVAEGTKTVIAARELGRALDVELPITEQVYLTLYEEKDPALAVKDLMTRELRAERPV